MPKFSFQSQYFMTKIIRIFLIFFSLKNTNLGAHFLLLTFLITSIFKSLYFLKWCPILDISPLHQYSKFNNFLWVYWFLGKNLFNFVPPTWKTQQPVIPHKLGLHILASSWLKFSLGPAYYIQTCQLLELKASDSYLLR